MKLHDSFDRNRRTKIAWNPVYSRHLLYKLKLYLAVAELSGEQAFMAPTSWPAFVITRLVFLRIILFALNFLHCRDGHGHLEQAGDVP